MANTNSEFYTNKEMAKICNVSESSMTNLAKSLELAPVKTGKYGRKYYDSGALIQVKAHYKNKTKPNANSKTSTKDDIIQQQQDHIADLQSQIKTLNDQLAVKDKQIEAQTDQVKQTSVLLSQSHTLTLQAQKRQDDESPDKVHNHPQTTSEDTRGWLWKIFH
ncbi:helix-turn-helix domain-containing protein [Liquorilactobacillus nagelii]|uniref:helix-turn-helix domain-containing protein n=1 Tax=Liquorilactobacillus nagelii TaxID=82688 RepID=UPI001CCAF62B|nr:helix-turn-helix domain-containing protein [Liquorilactobacillus nagelii]ULQ49345.1 helix-turn-helix domain-containing protein [Liquorilactobacillus nagelii]